MSNLFDLGSYRTEIVLDSSKFKAEMANAEQSLNAFQEKARNFSSRISTLATTAIAGISTAIAGAATAGIKANADLEQYRNTLNTVMGDTKKAGETLEWVKQYAAKTPFDIPGLVEATVKLQAMQLETQKFLPMAADMAAVFQSSGKTVSDAAEAINDAMMGEFERLKEFGIKLSQTDFKEGGKYAGKTYAEALEEEFKKRNYAGAAEALSNTFLGRLSTLKDTFGEFLRDATSGLFNTLSEKLGNLMTKIDQLKANGTLQEWVNQAKQAFETAFAVFEKVGNFLVSIGKFIYDNWNIILPVISGVLAGFMAFNAITGIINLINTMKTAFAALNAVMAANPIGLVAVAIGGLVAAIMYAYNNIESFRNFVNTAFANVSQYISSFVESGKQLFNQFASFVKTIWQQFGNDILQFAQSTWQNIFQVIQGTLKIIQGILQTVTSAIRGDWSGVWNGILKILEGIWTTITGLVKQSMNTIQSILSTSGSVLRSIATTIFNLFFNGVREVFSSIFSWISSAVQSIINIIRGFGTVFFNIGREIFNYLWNGIKETWNGIQRWISEKISWIADQLTFWDNSSKKINNSYDKIRSYSSSVSSSIPKYAQGTPYVPTNQLAFLHKGEAVIPAKYNPFNPNNQLKNVQNSTTTNTFHINPSFNIQITGNMKDSDMKQQAKKFTKYVMDELSINFKSYGFNY